MHRSIGSKVPHYHSSCAAAARRNNYLAATVRPSPAHCRLINSKSHTERHWTTAAAASKRTIWLETTNQAALTAAVECGYSTALFNKDSIHLAKGWQQLVKFEALDLQTDDTIQDTKGHKIGQRLVVSSKADLQAAEAAAQQPGYLMMDATDWKVIPAENLVAAFQSGQGQLLGVATTAADARVMLEALEAGTAGVVLRTDDPVQVKQLAAYLVQREAEGAPVYHYEEAKVTRVSPVGMCDRVCVDLCSLLRPGEGMLVGSFARALFLVHSECMESQYINSRPFRVNAGAVHAYVQAPNDKTAYLSELKSGSEVLVADAAGRAHTAVVGRCKIETRPMMLVEVETADGLQHSTLLQNAETVRLIGPSRDSCNATSSPAQPTSAGSSSSSSSGQLLQLQQQWQAIAVTELQPGQHIFILQQGGARHTGISIQENINEK